MSDEKTTDITVDKETGIWRLDIDAYLPTPAGYVKIEGTEYPIFSFMDVPGIDSLRIVKLAEDIRGAKTYEEQYQRVTEQIRILNRGPAFCSIEKKLIPETALVKLTQQQLITLAKVAEEISGVPRRAVAVAGSVNGSVSSTPAPADSLDRTLSV